MTKFTYLDDEPVEAVRPYIRAVQTATVGLEISHFHPQPYPKQMEALRDRHRQGNLDGLILDLRLDQFPDSQTGAGRADYRAATLAQEIRTRATEGSLPEFPIVLWSTDERLRRSYVNDDTSHDLFDLKALKEQIEQPDGAARLGTQLLALVDGYRRIQLARTQKRGTNRGVLLLGFEEAPSFLDERILNHFVGFDAVLPSHEIARFVLRELIDQPGPLIDDAIFAARLGVDRHRSPDFEKLAQQFSPAAYTGVFAGGWRRWWSATVDQTWRSIGGTSPALRSLPAIDRVARLRSHLGLRLLSAPESRESGTSTSFWTVCQASGEPLDPKEGYLLDRQPQYPWQDRLYVALSSLLDGTAKAKRMRIDPLESERFTRAVSRLKTREQA